MMEKLLLRILEPVILALLKKTVALVLEKIEVKMGKIDSPVMDLILEELNRTESLDRTREIAACLARGECQLPTTTAQEKTIKQIKEVIQNG